MLAEDRLIIPLPQLYGMHIKMAQLGKELQRAIGPVGAAALVPASVHLLRRDEIGITRLLDDISDHLIQTRCTNRAESLFTYNWDTV
ncbi:hypothetical protein J3P89_15950 [Pseudomonas sp. Z1-14]|uniref:hypothetical protein n=1 Tax=Pseudomonas sp. Z1-14 TaxID=2817409 RepID=UPI003DA7FD57